MESASFIRKVLSVTLGILLMFTVISVNSTADANEPEDRRPSDFGIRIVGNECPIGTYARPTWLAQESNRLYVVDSLNARVQAILNTGEAQFSFGLYGSHEHLMSSPGGITCFQKKIYWLDSFYGKILVRANRPDDEFEDELRAINPNTGKSYMVNPSDISAYKGLIYIANTGAKNIIAIDLKDQLSLTIPATDGENYTFNKPTGIAVAEDKIFVTEPIIGKVLCFNADGTFVSSFSGGDYPFGIAIDDGRIYITDPKSNKVNVFATDGTPIDSFGSTGTGRGQFNSPIGVAILDDKVYVSSANNNRVDVFKKDGIFVESMPSDDDLAKGTFGLPTDIAVVDNKYVVSDPNRCKVLLFENDSFVSEFGKRGAGTKELLEPTGVDYDSFGNIYVADKGNHCVKVFNSNGKHEKNIGSKGSGNGKLNSPTDVTIASSLGKIFVSDTGNHLIQVFSTSGEFLAQFGGAGSGHGELNLPKGITTDGRKILVADSANCRLQEFDTEGNYITEYGYKGRGQGMLFFPSGCAYGESGMIYAADTYNDRFVVFDDDSYRTWDYGVTGGPNRAIFFSNAGWENALQLGIEYEEAKGFYMNPQAIACGSQGIIVADTMNHRLQITPYNIVFRYPRVDEAMFTHQNDINTYYTVSPSILDFGVMSVGKSSQKRIEIRNWSGAMLSGSISIDQEAPFVSVEPKNFVGDNVMINVKVDTNGMASGTKLEATLIIKTNKDKNGNPKEIPVKVAVSDSYGFTINPNTNLFVKMHNGSSSSMEIELEPQNGFDGNVNLSYSLPRKRCMVPNGSGEGGSTHPHRNVKNVDCSGFALSALNISFEPSTIRFRDGKKSTIVFKPRGELKPGIYEIDIKMESAKAENKTLNFTITLLVNPSHPDLDGHVPRTVLTETFTAVWCQYCPFHREAQYRLANEYGYSRVIPIAYYADAPNDNSGMTQIEHNHRYHWYTQEGLPTTLFNGIANFSEGDGPFERQDPPPDRLEDRKMSGSSYSYWRFLQRLEDHLGQPSPLNLFLQGEIGETTGDAYLEINTLQDVSNYRNLSVYFVLVENNVEFSAVNGEEEHSLTVMKMLHHLGSEPSPDRGHLGDPIELPLGVTHYDMTFKLPTAGTDFDWTTLYKNCFLVAWIQDNTTKEILQSTMCDLKQPLHRKYSFTQIETDMSVQAGARPVQSYVLTNLGNIPMDFKLDMDHISGEEWESVIMIDSVPATNGRTIKLYPMQSSLIEVSMDIPPESIEGTESKYIISVSELSSGDNNQFSMDMIVEPAKPPSFEMKTFGKAVVDVAPGQTAEFKISINSINEYDNPVNLSLSEGSSEYLSATFTPAYGVPPFESIVFLKASNDLKYIESGYKVIIKGTGSDIRGEPFDKTFEMKAKAKKLDVELLPERHIITSCAINEICKQTQVDVNVKGGLQVKSIRMDFVYDDQYLDVTHISLGEFMTRSGEQPIWEPEHAPGRISINIRRDQTAVFADRDINTVISFTLKAKGDKLRKDDIRIGIENISMFDAEGNSIIVISKDATLAIRQNAEAPEIDLGNPMKVVAPWPTEEEAKRRREEQDYNYSDIETNESSMFIKGKIKSEEGLSQVTLYIDGKIHTVGDDGSFETQYNLSPGYNNIVIIARNFTGEGNAITIVVYLDEEPPALTVIKPNENLLDLGNSMTTGEREITFMGYTDEGVQLSIAGEEITIKEDPFAEDYDKRWYFEKNVALINGLNEIDVVACDSYNNCRRSAYKITYQQGAVARIRLKLWVNEPKFVINNKQADDLDPMPTTKSPPLPAELAGNSYMPVRAVFEALGATVEWIDADRRVDVTLGNTFLQLWVDNVSTAKINGVETTIIGADGQTVLYPTIVNGRTMLPLRFACESLGADVNWIAEESAIEVVYPSEK